MKLCPQCASPSVENLGGRETYRSVIIRRYLCHDCGYAWYTEETHRGPISRRVRAEVREAAGTDAESAGLFQPGAE